MSPGDRTCAGCGDPFAILLQRASKHQAAVYCVRCRIFPSGVRVAREVTDGLIRTRHALFVGMADPIVDDHLPEQHR